MPEFKLGLLAGGVSLEKKGGGGGEERQPAFLKCLRATFTLYLVSFEMFTA
jgi:hypothetical protein